MKKKLASPALAYAYLSAAYDAGATVRSPLHTLKPLIVSVFESSRQSSLRRDEVARLFTEIFGIEIPLNVLSYVMASMVNSDSILFRSDVKAKSGIAEARYVLSDKSRMSETNAIKEKAMKLWRYATIHIEKQLAYASFNFGTPADVLEQFLDTSSVGFVGQGGKAFAASTADRALNQFIFHCLEADSDGKFLESLTELAIGDVLYQSIKSVTEYESEFDQAINRSMKDVSVYFDTRFLLNLIGVNGVELEKSAKETLNLSLQTSCKVKVYTHTLEEIDSILVTVSGKMHRGFAADGGVASFALERGMTPSDLLEFAARIPDKISELGITVERAPELSVELSVDERDLHRRLEVDLRQKNVDARVRDIASLTGVFREREGMPHVYLEDSRAIFVTTNKGLADSATSFFRKHFIEEGLHNTVQICMTDVVFSARLWIKLPTSAKKLPKDQVIAHILTNLRPNEQLRENFLRKLRNLVEDGKFSDMHYAVVALSRFTDRLLAADYDLRQTQLETDQAISAANKIVSEFRRTIDRAKRTSRPEDLRRIEELERQIVELGRDSSTASELGMARVELIDLKTKFENERARKLGADKAVGRIAAGLAYVIATILVLAIFAVAFGYLNETSPSFSVLNVFLALLTVFGLSAVGLVRYLANKIVKLINYRLEL